MSPLIRNSLFAVMLLACVVLGTRSYLELTAQDRPAGAGPVVGAPEQMPEFVLDDVWGDSRSISEWAGKPLMLNFWATWCAPCRREMPLLETLHTDQQDIQVLGVAIDRQPDVQSYLAEAGITYPSLVGEEDAMAVSDLFGLAGLGLPFTVLAGSSGQILTVHIGELDLAELTELVDTSRAFERGELNFAQARERLAEL